MKWKEWVSKLNIFIVGALGTATAIVSFVILFRQNFHLTIIVLATLLLATLWLGCLYLILSRIRSPIVGANERYRFPRARMWAFLAILATLLLLLASFFIKPVQDFTYIAFGGTPTAFLSSASISSVRIGKSQENYVVETTVQNPTGYDRLITHIRILTGFSFSGGQCASPIETFEISKSITTTNATTNTVTFVGGMTQKSAEFSGYVFPVRGSTFHSCGISRLTLDFDTSIIIPKDTYSTFVIYIPEEFNVTKGSSCFQGRCSSRSSDKIYIPLFDGTEGNTIVTRATPTPYPTPTKSVSVTALERMETASAQIQTVNVTEVDVRYITIEAIIDPNEIMPYRLSQHFR